MLCKHQKNETRWEVQVEDSHRLPVVGPAEALRVLLVFREYEDEDPDYSPSSPSSSSSSFSADALAAEEGALAANKDRDSDDDEDEDETDNTPPPPPPPPPAPPAVGAGGNRVQRINELTVQWLVREYGDRRLVAEIRDTALPDSKRVPQGIQTLVAWSAEVYYVKATRERVPVNALTGIAGGRVITNANIAELFQRGSAWIKSALVIHGVVEGHRNKRVVAEFLKTDTIWGINSLESHLVKLVS
ncbi:hypothetical protein B0H16DRAFT_1624808 [Mycena metata]|uniref:Uncharacterized protein n=1 Tax=Mycena metata TaxID=1033252 RepID=A0AAD7H5P4_9AGAR|nr:hypothetical protein B0H16DRAFT_1624808 [Mycena metata]